MTASLFQLLGLGAMIVGASMEYGTSGAVASSGIAVVYIGLAMEREV